MVMMVIRGDDDDNEDGSDDGDGDMMVTIVWIWVLRKYYNDFNWWRIYNYE